ATIRSCSPPPDGSFPPASQPDQPVRRSPSPRVPRPEPADGTSSERARPGGGPARRSDVQGLTVDGLGPLVRSSEPFPGLVDLGLGEGLDDEQVPDGVAG